MEKNQMNLRQVLLSELASRQSRNPSYSLRAFARDLGIGKTSLSDVLNQKRDLSTSNTKVVADSLGLRPDVVRQLKSSVALARLDFQDEKVNVIEDDTFRLISDWYYIGILNLALLSENSSDPKWISERLGITITMATDAVERLQRLGYLKVLDGRLERATQGFRSGSQNTSAARRNYHRQSLTQAIESLEKVDPALRELGSITFPFDITKIDTAKQMILKFKRELAKAMEGGNMTEVYQLAVQLFPLTKKAEK